MNELTASINRLAKSGEALAMAERDYKVVLRQHALKLRVDNMPVTLINNIVYGIDEVAEKRFKRDVAEATYKANQEHINVTKLKLKLLEAQLSREWGHAGKDL